MEPKIKNALGIAGVITLAFIAIAAVVFAKATLRANQTQAPSFTVSAEGKVVAIPTIATFTFSVITEGGSDIAKLQTENAQKVNKAISFLKDNGVEEKDIATTAYEVNPQYEYIPCPLLQGTSGSQTESLRPDIYPRPCPPPSIQNYTVTQTVSVKVRNLNNVGTLLSGVVKNGGNLVSQLYFTVEDEASLKNQARTKAFEEARKKAKAMADAGGFRIGKLLSVGEDFSLPIPMLRGEGFVKPEGGGGISTSPEVKPGSQEITATVTLTYEIKQGSIF